MEQRPLLTEADEDELIVALYNAAQRVATEWIVRERRDDAVHEFILDCIRAVRWKQWEWPVLSLDRFVEVTLLTRKASGLRSRTRLAVREGKFLRTNGKAPREWMSQELLLEEEKCREILAEGRRKLPRRARRIHVLLRDEELTYREVAQRVGVSVCCVHETVKVVHERFRKELRAEGIEVPIRGAATARTEQDDSEQPGATSYQRRDGCSLPPKQPRRLAS